jgi:hypothetical protein
MITTASMAEMASMQVSDVPHHGKYLKANVIAGRQLQVVNIIGNYIAGYVSSALFTHFQQGFRIRAAQHSECPELHFRMVGCIRYDTHAK